LRIIVADKFCGQIFAEYFCGQIFADKFLQFFSDLFFLNKKTKKTSLDALKAEPNFLAFLLANNQVGVQLLPLCLLKPEKKMIK